MRTLWLDFSLAFRNVVRQRRRSAIAIGAVAFGITALILASGFIEWIFMDFRESTIQSQLGHLQIVKPGYHDAGKADPYAFLLPEAIPELEAPNEPRQIKTVAPRLSFSGLVSHGDATLSFIGDGVSPQDEAAFGKGLQVSSGTNLSADQPLAIIMGEGLARNLGVKVGDKVVLLANTATGARTQSRFPSAVCSRRSPKPMTTPPCACPSERRARCCAPKVPMYGSCC